MAVSLSAICKGEVLLCVSALTMDEDRETDKLSTGVKCIAGICDCFKMMSNKNDHDLQCWEEKYSNVWILIDSLVLFWLDIFAMKIFQALIFLLLPTNKVFAAYPTMKAYFGKLTTYE